MSGNTLGELFRVTNFGESHGPAIGCIVDGCPPLMSLSEADIQKELDRRKTGSSKLVTQRKEPDQVQILSGVFEGKTTGTPIMLLIQNEDAKSKDYDKIKKQFRPGHADFTYFHKYGIRDYRGGGRSSARLTAPSVAAGAIAKKYLREQFGVEIKAYLAQVGTLEIPFESWEAVHQNPYFLPNLSMIDPLTDYVNKIRSDLNSVGARINCVATKVPVGLGDPIYNKLDADLAYALMGINAAKGVEIGAGFNATSQLGSEHCDQMTKEKGFLSNNAGGILGGISTGQDILASVAFKPTSSLARPQQSIDTHGNDITCVTTGRHDPCVGIRAVPIVEAMVALVLMDHVLIDRAKYQRI